jgi:hypothetical protein
VKRGILVALPQIKVFKDALNKITWHPQQVFKINTGWSRGNAFFSYKNNFVYFQHKKVLITQKEGILLHF